MEGKLTLVWLEPALHGRCCARFKRDNACQTQDFYARLKRDKAAQNSKQQQMAHSLRLVAKTTALGVLPTSISKITIQIQFPSARFQE